MSNFVAPQISLFRSHILNRSFNDATLRVIESVMASKAANSSTELRSSMREFLRSESMSVMREGAEKPVEQKILDLDFLVRAFALLGDFESCLALRYEAFTLREFKSTSYQWLEVSYLEWLNFAEQSLDYGFHSIARKACENALSCIQKNSRAVARENEHLETAEIIEKIKTLKDIATASAASHSVQAQAAKYTKSKPVNNTKACSLVCKRTQLVATTLFRKGIRERNLRNLHQIRRSVEMTNEPNTGQI